MTTMQELARRIERVEARQAISELPARYAIAVDSRDMDSWVSLFVDDVDCGQWGKGRDALRSFIAPHLRTFYRSIHHICGHVVDFENDERATGTVYCRAEHEDGEKWFVMAIVYFDNYVRRDGRWFFERRSEKHWYAADVLERPHPPFQSWDKVQKGPALPNAFPLWRSFWDPMDKDAIDAITRQP